MAMSTIVYGGLWLLSLVVVGAGCMAWGKAHPTIQSAIAGEVDKIAKKL